jgi:hypothetical protein
MAQLSDVKTMCDAYNEVRVQMSEGLESLRSGVDDVARLDATLQSIPTEIEPVQAQIQSQLAAMQTQSRNALSFSEVLQKATASLKEEEIKGLADSLMSSLEGARQLNQMLQGLPDIALRARDMGMPTEVERLRQGLAEFNTVLRRASTFEKDVKRLGEMWTKSNLGTLVDQNRAMLTLVKSPMHILGRNQQHRSATKARISEVTTARKDPLKHTSNTVKRPLPGSIPRPTPAGTDHTDLVPDNDSPAQSNEVSEPLLSTSGLPESSSSLTSLQESPVKTQSSKDDSLEKDSRLSSMGTILSTSNTRNGLQPTSMHVMNEEALSWSTEVVPLEADSLQLQGTLPGSLDAPLDITDLEKPA